MSRLLAGCLLLLSLVMATGVTRAQDRFRIVGPAGERLWSGADLRGHNSATDITIPSDPVFRRAMTYRAVPVAGLLAEVGIGPDDYVQARAVDNFSVAIPARLLMAGAAFLAVEDPAKPWPSLQKGGQSYEIGPFYLVWKDARGVSSEFWAYRLAALSAAESPQRRWPQLSAPAGDAYLQLGRDKFVEICLACHRFAGAGEGTQGPDLAQPMNPVDYFQPGVLKKLVREPDSVRSWPDRKMPAFDTQMLSEQELDAMIAWLAHKARTR